MAIAERITLYREIEALRGRPLVVYVTSSRPGAQGQMAGDVVAELLAQLQALPAGTTELDLLIASQGGDPTVAWRIVSLLRERVKRFSVLVPQAAFSAATLLALGADAIVMHPHGNLGPVDTQISVSRPANGSAGTPQEVRFGSEDLQAFFDFATDNVGLKDQEQLARVFELVCQEIGAVPVGVASRGASLSLSMGEKLLLTHMRDEADKEKAKSIASALSKNYFHHGYPVSRSEARELGLKVEAPDAALEQLMWRVWLDIEDELQLRVPFNAVAVLRAAPECAPLFDAVPQVNIPPAVPAAIAQQILLQAAGQATLTAIPGAPYLAIAGLCESARWATRHVTRGRIFAARMPDLQFRVSQVQEEQGWVDVDLNLPGAQKEDTPASQVPDESAT